MSKITLSITGLVGIVLVGGLLFLMTWDIPAPSQPVNKTISNDRFPS